MTVRPPSGRAHDIGRLYASHRPRLRNALRAKLLQGQHRTGLQSSLIDDVIQDVFARLLASSTRLAEARDPVAYLMAMARNLYVDRLRRERREALLASAEMLEAIGTSVLHRIAPEDAEHDGLPPADATAMTAYVASLPPDLSLTYDARFVRGLSQRDAAALLGVSRWQVREREERVLAGIRRLLAGSSKKVPPNSEG